MSDDRDIKEIISEVDADNVSKEFDWRIWYQTFSNNYNSKLKNLKKKCSLESFIKCLVNHYHFDQKHFDISFIRWICSSAKGCDLIIEAKQSGWNVAGWSDQLRWVCGDDEKGSARSCNPPQETTRIVCFIMNGISAIAELMKKRNYYTYKYQ